MVRSRRKFTHLAENNISLIQLGIYNESKVTVELQPVGSERVLHFDTTRHDTTRHTRHTAMAVVAHH